MEIHIPLMLKRHATRQYLRRASNNPFKMSTETIEPSGDSPNSIEMEETVARIRSHKNVEAVIIMDYRGAPEIVCDERSSSMRCCP